MTGAATESPMTGLGVDIVEIDRMDRILQRSPRFAYRVFSDDERAYCEGLHRPAVRYATHFAAKEAVARVLPMASPSPTSRSRTMRRASQSRFCMAGQNG